MLTPEQLERLEQDALQYFGESGKISFGIEDRQEELDGLMQAYQGMNDTSAQVLRQYFLKGGDC